MLIWTLLQEKFSTSNSSYTAERHSVESRSKSAIPGSERTGWTIAFWRQEARRSHAHPMDMGQASGVGRHSPWRLRQLVHRRHSDNSIGGGKPRRKQQTAKYQELAKTHLFAPIAIETGGAWNEKAVEFISEVERRITEVTNEQQETMFLFQRISVALQRERDRVQEHIPVRALIFKLKACHSES